MNQIQITKDYRLTSNPRSWRVEKCTGMDLVEGKQKWKIMSHGHETPEQALLWLKHNALREANCKSMAALLETAKSISDTLRIG